MSGDRTTPHSSPRRGGELDLTDPAPSTSPSNGGGNPEHGKQNNAEVNARKMIEIDPTKARIFHVQTDPPSLLASLNGFVIRKVLTGALDTNHTCKRLRSGTLRVEVETAQQARALTNLKAINYVPITVTAPFASNTCKGVVTHFDLANMTEDEIVREMTSQHVIACRQFLRTNRRTQLRELSHTVCLTFATTVLPEKVRIGYDIRPVRPFVPKPIRCNKCQRYGHTQKAC